MTRSLGAALSSYFDAIQHSLFIVCGMGSISKVSLHRIELFSSKINEIELSIRPALQQHYISTSWLQACHRQSSHGFTTAI